MRGPITNHRMGLLRHHEYEAQARGSWRSWTSSGIGADVAAEIGKPFRRQLAGGIEDDAALPRCASLRGCRSTA